MGMLKKMALGLGLASGALVAFWLLSGKQGKKTRQYWDKKKDELKDSFSGQKIFEEENESQYI